MAKGIPDELDSWMQQLKAYMYTPQDDSTSAFEYAWKTMANNRHCPKCGHLNDSMQNTIQDKKGQTISRECQACGLWYSGPNFEPYVSDLPGFGGKPDGKWAKADSLPTPGFAIVDDYTDNMTTLDGEPWKEYMKRYDAIQRPEVNELPRTQHQLSDGSGSIAPLPDGTPDVGQ